MTGAIATISIPISEYTGDRFELEQFQPPTAEEELARIGALRRELATLERRLEDATDRLKDSPEWDLVQGLKEDRKVLAKKLDRAIDATMSWAQPRMI